LMVQQFKIDYCWHQFEMMKHEILKYKEAGASFTRVVADQDCQMVYLHQQKKTFCLFWNFWYVQFTTSG
jgi:hypothetical protein